MKVVLMNKPKSRQPRRFWEHLSDEQLLSVELTTDDPENLPNIIQELPPGDEEPHVEYKYDLRGSTREYFRCVHGNHPHLAGFVMRKGNNRFLVGHMCGKKIYGESFEHYTADFDAALNRRDALRRKKEIEEATEPFDRWLDEVSASAVFEQYETVCDRIYEHMQWIYGSLPRAAAISHRRATVVFPPTLFSDHADPVLEFQKSAADCKTAILSLVGRPDHEVSVDKMRRHFAVLLDRLETSLDQLKELEDFFQPGVLTAICDLANQYDKPKKRHYTAGLMEITCKRGNKAMTVKMPRHFQLPDRAPLEAFRKALGALAL